MKFIASNEAT